MSPQEYSKLVTDNITTKYKGAKEEVIKDIDNESSSIAQRLDIADRVDPNVRKPAFITLKDHKEDFNTRPQVRLINPTKC